VLGGFDPAPPGQDLRVVLHQPLQLAGERLSLGRAAAARHDNNEADDALHEALQGIPDLAGQ
jgi:hypothetical protein